MLGKILLTMAVILIAFALVRQRAREKSEATPTLPGSGDDNAAGTDSNDPGLARDLRIGAYLFLVLMVGLAGVLYYYRWRDQHTVVTVTLYRDGQQAPISYEVYKHELGERRFTTIDGLTVTVAASERMVVEGLED